jgi:predicted DNA binding protein
MIETTKQPPLYGSQQYIDWVNLLYHRRVAEHLLAEPEKVLNKARHNLARWKNVHEGTGSEAAWEEWMRLLDTKSLAELVAIFTEDSDEGQRLRSSTPFTGILSAEERAALRRACEQGALL